MSTPEYTSNRSNLDSSIPDAASARGEPSSHRLAAIVTGGAGEGIGHGITEALTAEGWAVLVVDRDAQQSSLLQKKLRAQGCAVEIFVADITDVDTPRLAVEIALNKFARIDGLVNNAGVGLCKPIAEASDADFERLFDVDLRAAFRFSRAVVPAMIRAGGGSIVNVGSVHTHKSIAGYGLYSSVKASLEGLTRGLALDYGSQMIRANSVHPGFVASPQNHALISKFTTDPDAWIERYVNTKQVIPSIPTARQVGDLVAWLLGPKALVITGQAITIDAGSSIMLYEKEVGA